MSENEQEDSEDLVNGLCGLFSEVSDFFHSNNSLIAQLQNVNSSYTEKTEIAAGGMKKIFRTTDIRSNRDVALAEPINPADSDIVNDFLIEARINAYLQHPNIIPVYEIALNEENCPYFTMKLIQGKTLADILKENPQEGEELSLSRHMGIFKKCCEAVAYAHSKGILHLDIKPENISVSDYGEVLVCDWGISEPCPESVPDELLESEDFKKLLPLVRSKGAVRGTAAYMAPEQIDAETGRKSPRTDIYSLGVLMYELLTLKKAFRIDREENFSDILEGSFTAPDEINPVIPAALRAVCLKAMNSAQAERYNSVNELLEELQRYEQGYATAAEGAGAWHLLMLLYKRNMKTCNVGLAALLIILTLSVTGMMRIRKSEKLAIVEKDKAVKAKNETMELLNRLKMEQTEKLKMSLEAANRYLAMVKTALYFKKYDRADELIETVWQLGAHSPEIKEFYSLFLASKLKFSEASGIAKGVPGNEDSFYLFDKVSREGLNIPSAIQVADLIIDLKDKNLAGYFLHNCQDQPFSIEEKMVLLEKEAQTNSRSRISFTYSLKDGLSIDLSKSQLSYPGALLKYDINRLNLSGTLISKPDVLPWKNLTYLDISNTKMKNLADAPNLQYLDIRNCPMDAFRGLNKMKKLEFIDIRGVKNFPLKALLALKSLKKVLIDRTQEKDEFLNKAHFRVIIN